MAYFQNIPINKNATFWHVMTVKKMWKNSILLLKFEILLNFGLFYKKTGIFIRICSDTNNCALQTIDIRK